MTALLHLRGRLHAVWGMSGYIMIIICVAVQKTIAVEIGTTQ